jgi:mono/diheme cytochrome c family protein
LTLWLVCWTLGVAPGQALEPAAPTPPRQSSSVPALDFEMFKTRVQPIFLARRTGFTRCVVCHSDGGVVGFLQPLSPGAMVWNEEQSRLNFERVSKLVTPGDPMKSRLLRHPLEPAAGGDEFHNGGRQFTSQDDPQFKTLAAWVRGQK